MSKKATFIKFLFVGVALLVAGCGTPTSDVTEEPAPGMPNPASVYCEEKGGTLEVRQSQDGEYGVCIFGDGSECDEWAFFRGECKPGDSTIAPAPEHYPRYINEQYGFSLDPSPDYAIEGWDNYTLFKRSGYVLFVGYKWADEEVGPFRTGVPAGDWVDGGTAELLGQEIPRSLLVYEGKVKAVFYGSMIEVGNLNLSMWLETDQGESVAYEDIDIPAEIQGEADQIVGSFALTSGEVPEVKAQPIASAGGGTPVMGWLGYVVSTPEGAQFDDYVIIGPEGEVGEFGIGGANEAVEAQIVALRDREEPGKYANFWGTLTCDVIDYGGCQILVDRVRVGTEVTEPEPVEGWKGFIVGLDPTEAQFDDYFVLAGDYPVRYGIASAIAENGWPIYGEELASFRDSGTLIDVWGQMICGVPDTNGCQIQVDRIEIGGVPVDPYEGWETYTNDEYGFTFRYPATWTLEEVPDEDTTSEGGPHFGNSVQLHQGSLMLYIGYKWATEDVLLGGTGLPAGDLESRGTVTFLGTELEKTVLVYEGKVKAMYYGVTEVGDLVFAIRLDDFSLGNYGDVDIPDAAQIEVDKILGSFGLTG